MVTSNSDPFPQLRDDGIKAFLAKCASVQPDDINVSDAASQRRHYNAMCRLFARPHPEGVTSLDEPVDGPGGPVPVRIYKPANSDGLPVMLYFHGGGFVVGDLESHDSICAELADRACVGVIAVDYRLAPEHRFPAAFEDCVAVHAALPEIASRHGFDPSRVVAAGDSAGGNLTAALALKLRDAGPMNLKGQILIYPSLGGDMTRGSYLSQANAPGLTTADMAWYKQMYIGPPDHPDHANKFARPLRETDYHGLPPAFVVAAGHDPLCDDSFEWRDRLSAAGIVATVRHEPDLIHAFLRARHMSKPAGESFSAICNAVRTLAHEGLLEGAS